MGNCNRLNFALTLKELFRLGETYMFDQQPNLELFFDQLGLDSSSEAIDQFI